AAPQPPNRPPHDGRFSPLIAPAVIVGAGFVLLGLLIAVVALCFLGDSRPRPDQALDDDPFVAQPLPKKAAPKKKSNPKPLIVLTPENEKRVEPATRRGVEYLKRHQTAQRPTAGA